VIDPAPDAPPAPRRVAQARTHCRGFHFEEERGIRERGDADGRPREPAARQHAILDLAERRPVPVHVDVVRRHVDDVVERAARLREDHAQVLEARLELRRRLDDDLHVDGATHLAREKQEVPDTQGRAGSPWCRRPIAWTAERSVSCSSAHERIGKFHAR
jgi:hypothetical protein